MVVAHVTGARQGLHGAIAGTHKHVSWQQLFRDWVFAGANAAVASGRACAPVATTCAARSTERAGRPPPARW